MALNRKDFWVLCVNSTATKRNHMITIFEMPACMLEVKFSSQYTYYTILPSIFDSGDTKRSWSFGAQIYVGRSRSWYDKGRLDVFGCGNISGTHITIIYIKQVVWMHFINVSCHIYGRVHTGVKITGKSATRTTRRHERHTNHCCGKLTLDIKYIQVYHICIMYIRE